MTWAFLALIWFVACGGASGLRAGVVRSACSKRTCSPLRCTDAPSDSSDAPFEAATTTSTAAAAASSTKEQLLAACASCDRGFGAARADRDRVEELLARLVAANPPNNPTAGLFPNNATADTPCPLQGVWRMVYTDAYDVLSLAASPFTLLQGIYQVIDADGQSVNVIDITSRLVPLLPSGLAKSLESVLRLKVRTASKARSSTRVGLRFQSIKVQPLTLLGQVVPDALSLAAALPQKTLYDAADAVSAAFGASGGEKISGAASEALDSIGFFDVVYLDSDLLVIRQNQPGGCFISSRLPGADLSSYL